MTPTPDTPKAGEAQAPNDTIDMVSKALRRAWQLGQTYWQQADSESFKQQARSDKTLEMFNLLIEETRVALTAERDKAVAERDALRAAAKQFYNLTIADPDVLIRAFTEPKREAIAEAGRVLSAALSAPAVEG